MGLFCVISAAPVKTGPAPLSEISDGQCCYPVGDDLFCGEEAAKGRVYCHDHCARAYLKRRPAITVPAGV